MNLHHMPKFLFVAGVAVVLSGCFSNKYSITYNTDPEGAQLYCNGKAKGYTPVKLYYKVDKEAKERGHIYTQPCVAKWVSGAKAEANNRFDINKFPNGVIHTIPRPNVGGYSQDAEFALKVQTMKSNSGSGGSSSTSHSVQCKKWGDLSFNAEIKTFSGTGCPYGWIKI